MMGTALKAVRVAALMGVYIAIAQAARLFIRDEPDARLFLIRHTRRYCRWILDALGVHVTVDGHENRTHGQYLIVANHLSYVDVFVIAATMPSVFVTSVEVAKTPFLGLMARCAGSLFIERRSKARLMGEIETVTSALKEGYNVVIFPEATTSAGNEVLPFRMSLLDAAVQSRVDVLPVCLNYDRVNGRRMNRVTRDAVFYYGAMHFLPHLRRLLGLRSIIVSMKVLPPIPVTAMSCRKHLALEARRAIVSSFVPVG